MEGGVCKGQIKRCIDADLKYLFVSCPYATIGEVSWEITCELLCHLDNLDVQDIIETAVIYLRTSNKCSWGNLGQNLLKSVGKNLPLRIMHKIKRAFAIIVAVFIGNAEPIMLDYRHMHLFTRPPCKPSRP